jgi:hypothetical protein
MARDKDDLWRNFPKTAIEFDRRFATEEACRAYWIEARWGGEPACADCDHQTSLTSGTLLEKTRKPFKVWFRAVFEISSRRNGISAKELQRILGLGSYKTAWSWLHKLRAALVRADREPLGPFVQIDEALVGGKGSPHKELVLVWPPRPTAGCVSPTPRTTMNARLKSFADSQIWTPRS